MPKKPMDYSKACIYKIACKDPNITDIYVGSTTNLAQRRYKHKNNCQNLNSRNYNYYVYQFIREHGGFDNFEVVKLEDYPCERFEELTKRERYWFEELSATLNKQVPSRTESEYYQDNQDKIREYMKQYHEQNRDKILEKKKEYRQRNQDKIREYREQNRDKILEKKKQYREQNRDKILEKYKQKFECECGGTYTLANKAQHFKTKKHQDYLKSIL